MKIQNLSPGAAAHLSYLKDSYSIERRSTVFSRAYRRLLARRYNLLIPRTASVLEVGCGAGDLLNLLHAEKKCGVDLSPNQIARAKAAHPHLNVCEGIGETGPLPEGQYDFIILSDVLNEAADVEMLLRLLHNHSHRGTRLIINIYNTLWRPILSLVRALGFSPANTASSWISRQDVVNLAMLAEWECFKSFGCILCPVEVPIVTGFVNRWIAPLIPWLCLSIFLIARRIPVESIAPKSVSVVIPARNEAGNIAVALERMPRLAENTEIIFVEGNSKDETWNAICSLPDFWAHGKILKLRQTGKGKGNAVIEGFRKANGEIVMILDADLTMPPEDLPKFVQLLCSGRADFANGVRLVYPMDEKAMQFANLCANKGFGMIFSWLLGQPIKDTLCGTKVLWRSDYDRLDQGRAYFGDFDPFGDFDLLFGADKLNLKIVDVPIRYRERFYGETNINRWRHGVILLRMVLFAARRLKFV